MDEKSPIFKKTYNDYHARVMKLDFAQIAPILGITVDGTEAVIPFWGKDYRVGPDGVKGPDGKKPSFSFCVVLFQYLLLCPNAEPHEKDWVTFKDFKDAAPFVGAFAKNAENPIAINFTDNLKGLEDASREIGGKETDLALSYDVVKVFDALPKVPILMLFNHADEEFPAQCSLLFERRAEKYIDMECLAIIGWVLSDSLLHSAGLVSNPL